MDKKIQKKIYCFINMIICGFAAFYLMCIIKQMTLATMLQEVFIWCYFWILLLVVLWVLKVKIIESMREHRIFNYIILFIILGWAITSGTKFLPEIVLPNRITISVLERKNNESQGQEVWFREISVDGLTQPLQIAENKKNGWILKGQAIYGSYADSKELDLILPKGKKIELTFARHSWSGMIEVQGHNYKQEHDLYLSTGDEYTIEIPGNYFSYTGMSHYFLLLGYYSFCIILVEVLMFLHFRFKKVKE